MSERLEEVKANVWKDPCTYAEGDDEDRKGYSYTLSDYDYAWLIQQAERVELLEELLTQVQYDREMAKNNAEEKIRYKQALEFYADKNNYVVDPSELELPEDIIDAVPPIVDERGKMARKALEG